MPTEDVKVLPLDPAPLVLVVDDELTPRSLSTRMVRSIGYLDPSLRVMLLADPRDPRVEGLLSGYRDLPFLPKPVSFGDLA
jgi:hypothetical protein